MDYRNAILSPITVTALISNSMVPAPDEFIRAASLCILPPSQWQFSTLHLRLHVQLLKNSENSELSSSDLRVQLLQL